MSEVSNYINQVHVHYQYYIPVPFNVKLFVTHINVCHYLLQRTMSAFPTKPEVWELIRLKNVTSLYEEIKYPLQRPRLG